MKTMYFGHPINTYGTELETILMAIITVKFPGWKIENPNQKHHQKGYRDWKENYGNGMEYYYKEVLPQCDAGIFLPFRDGKWGAGVFGEAEFIYRRKGLIFEITHAGIVTGIKNISDVPALNVEETRQRIRTASGETVPY